MSNALRLMPSALKPLDAPGDAPLAPREGFDVAAATRAVGRGDARAFECIYRSWFDRVYAFARATTRRDEAFCLDVTQEVMLRAARTLPPLETEPQLGAWFTRAALSASVDMLRRERRRAAREQRRSNPQPPSAIDPDELRWLRERLESLPPIDQSLLMQRIAQGLTLRQAGLSVGISEQAAHGRIRRALAQIRSLAKEVWCE